MVATEASRCLKLVRVLFYKVWPAIMNHSDFFFMLSLNTGLMWYYLESGILQTRIYDLLLRVVFPIQRNQVSLCKIKPWYVYMSTFCWPSCCFVI